MANLSPTTLPKGIWYEQSRRRWRVRRYRNKTVYGPFYYTTFEEAMRKLDSLNSYLDSIPKVRKPRAPNRNRSDN